MTWKCIMCKKTVEIDLGKVGMKCPFCDGKIFIKERPTTAKRITAK
jgi:DNA-directed RNA polymerase subunit RPC12/RpoP